MRRSLSDSDELKQDGEETLTALAKRLSAMHELIHGSHRNLKLQFIRDEQTGTPILRTTLNAFRMLISPQNRPVLVASKSPANLELKRIKLPGHTEKNPNTLSGWYLKNPGEQRVVTARDHKTRERFAIAAAIKYEQDMINYNFSHGWLKRLDQRLWLNSSVMYWVQPLFQNRKKKIAKTDDDGNALYTIHSYSTGDKEAPPIGLGETRLQRILGDGMVFLGTFKGRHPVTLQEAEKKIAEDFFKREHMMDRHQDPGQYRKDSFFTTRSPIFAPQIHQARLKIHRITQETMNFFLSVRGKDLSKLTATGVVSSLYKSRHLLVQATSMRVMVLTIGLNVFNYVNARIKGIGNTKRASDMQTFLEKNPREAAPKFWKPDSNVASLVPHYNIIDYNIGEFCRAMTIDEANILPKEGAVWQDGDMRQQEALRYISDIYSSPGGSVFEQIGTDLITVNEQNGLLLHYLQTDQDHHVTYCTRRQDLAVKNAYTVASHLQDLLSLQPDQDHNVIKVFAEKQGEDQSGQSQLRYIFLSKAEFEADMQAELQKIETKKKTIRETPVIDDTIYTDMEAYERAREIDEIERSFRGEGDGNKRKPSIPLRPGIDFNMW